VFLQVFSEKKFLNPLANTFTKRYYQVQTLLLSKLPNVISALFATLNWGRGGGGWQSLFCQMCLNFAILAGTVSRVMSKIAA
jgi:hypothetical protein